MPHYAALDVSNNQTALHVVDEAGRTVWRGKRASDPEALAAALRRHAPELVRVGLETGFLTPWLYQAPPVRSARPCGAQAPAQKPPDLLRQNRYEGASAPLSPCEPGSRYVQERRNPHGNGS